MCSIERAAEILNDIEKYGVEGYLSELNRDENGDEELQQMQSDYIHSIMQDASATNNFGTAIEKTMVTLRVEGSLKEFHENPEKRQIKLCVPTSFIESNAASCSNITGARIVSQCSTFPFEIGWKFNGTLPCTSKYIGTSAKAYDHIIDTTNGEIQVDRELFSFTPEEKADIIKSPFHYLSMLTDDDIKDSIVTCQKNVIILVNRSFVANIAETISKESNSGKTFHPGKDYTVVDKQLGERAIKQAHETIERCRNEVFEFKNISAEIERVDGAQFNNVDLVCDGNGFISADALVEQKMKAFVRVELEICTKYVTPGQ